MAFLNSEQNSLSLKNFEGPLAFLVYLVQKSEISLNEISVFEITEQYLTQAAKERELNLDAGAEFIDYTGLLIWLKSKKLLPSESLEEDLAALQAELPFDILPQLLEYCRFKKVAKELSEREEGQNLRFSRGLIPTSEEFPKPLGVERVSLDELGSLFQELLEKANAKKEIIHEEEWRVSDKISHLRDRLKSGERFRFSSLFGETVTKNEIVVTFLAMLELMKMGLLDVIHDETKEHILLIRGAYYE